MSCGFSASGGEGDERRGSRGVMEKIIFKKIELWLVLLLLLAGAAGSILFGGLVQEAAREGSGAGRLGAFALELASLPANLKILYRKGLGWEAGQLVQKNTQILSSAHARNFTQLDPEFHDDGILLVSAYSRAAAVSTVYLYDLREERKLWEWIPDPEEIVRASPSLRAAEKEGRLPPIQTRALFRAQHPYLLADGSLVLSGGEGPLARLNPCGKMSWAIDRQFHHSIEGAGDNLVVPIVTEGNRDNAIGKNFRDDGYAVVSPEGKIVEEVSIIDILRRGGYEGLLFGQASKGDRIHLNDAEFITRSDDYVQAGDIMLSARNLSTVFLYRPAADKIVWLRTGPWLNQHDVDYLGNGQFAILGNDLDPESLDYAGRGNSNLYLYDMKDGLVTKPYEKLFRAHKLATPTEGSQRILDNGDLFLEMTAGGELLRGTPSKLRWRYVHRLSDREIGALHWARYFKRQELNLAWLEQEKCE